MLLKLFPSIKESLFFKIIHWFYYSYVYVALIGILTLLSCIFGIEMPVYYVFIFLGGVIPSLLLEDMTPTLAPLAMAYSSVSLKTNNAEAGTALYGNGREVNLYYHIILIIIFVFGRFIYEMIFNKERRCHKPQLLVGYILFGAALMFGGLTSGYYSKKNFYYGAIQMLALSGCYFFLLYLIDWKSMKKDYFFNIMMTYGIVIALEVFYIILFHRGDEVTTGWGIRNNIAGQMCLCICAPLYLAMKSKKLSWLYAIASIVILLGICSTNSRGGAGAGATLFVAGLALFFIFAGMSQRIQMSSVIAGAFLILVILMAFIPDQVLHFFGRLTGSDLSPGEMNLFKSSRMEIWKDGAAQFMSHPGFGVGYYECAAGRAPNFNYDFIPPRYHNTYVQILASLGLFGAFTFIYHRYEMFKLTFKHTTLEKTFIFLSIMGLLVSSLVDCHFFNLGPGLNYTIALAFIEGINIKDGVGLRKPNPMALIN